MVVTGMGAVTPIGTTVADFWAGCRRAQVGVGPIDGFDVQDLKILIAAQVKDFDPKARLKHFRRDKIILHADRYSWFAAAAADEAVNMAGLQLPFEDPYRVACIIGSGGAGLVAVESRLSRPVRQEQARHPSFDAAAHHRIVRRGACRHRVRRQGPDVCHLQRLFDGRTRVSVLPATTSVTAWSILPLWVPPRP